MKVIVFPKDKNPYQELLYSEITKQKVEVKYLKLLTKSHTSGMLLLPLQLIYYRVAGYSIFHLHWLYDFSSSSNILFVKLFARYFYAYYLITTILFVKLLNYKLVWTVHNIVPHEKQFFSDTFITKCMANMSDICIVHTLKAKADLERLDINSKRIIVIPHGSYIDRYNNEISRTDARKKLGLREEDFIFLFFGQIRNYKGIPDLLKSFKQIAKDNKQVKLIIAGACSNPSILTILNRYKNEFSSQISLYLFNIPDDDVQTYMNSADIVVLPFKKVTTSGSLILAMSFGKPVVYPKVLFNEIPDSVGYGYYNNDLHQAMIEAKNDKEMSKKGSSAREHIESFNWHDAAEKTYKVYKELLENV